jgi:hypothetical protein
MLNKYNVTLPFHAGRAASIATLIGSSDGNLLHHHFLAGGDFAFVTHAVVKAKRCNIPFHAGRVPPIVTHAEGGEDICCITLSFPRWGGVTSQLAPVRGSE